MKKQKLTELLGTSTRRYRQVVMTTYVFNPVAFEALLLPHLRRIGITNVVVFVDREQWQRSLENGLTGTLRTSQDYTIIPIKGSPSFHPKMLLAVGEHHGVLAIGSGNLTAGGMGGNAEIWAGYERSKTVISNDGLFGRAWAYINKLMVTAGPVQRASFGWLTEYARWLLQLPAGVEWSALDAKREVRLLTSPGPALFEVLLETVAGRAVQEVTVISPFYDRDGRTVHRLNELFSPELINCLADEDFGGLPDAEQFRTSANAQQGAGPQVQWKDWKSEVGETDSGQYRRSLHAKLIHLRLEEEEIVLFGSANCTEAALGGPEIQGRNHEASIILRRKGRGDYLKELGLLPVDFSPLVLKEQPETTTAPADDDLSERRGNSITVAEYLEEHLRISLLLDPSPGTCVRALLPPRKGQEEGFIDFKLDQKEAKWPWSSRYAELCDRLALYTNGERISAFTHLTNADRLAKNNPDPRREKLRAAMQDFEENSGYQGLDKLLKFFDINRMDTKEAARPATMTGAVRLEYTDSPSASPLTPEEFAELGQGIMAAGKSNSNLFNRAESPLLTILRTMNRAVRLETAEDAEQLSFLASTIGEEEFLESSEEEELRNVLPVRDQKALLRYLKTVIRYLDNYNLLPGQRLSFNAGRTGPAPEKPGYNQFSSLTCALHLLKMYRDDELSEEDGSTIRVFPKNYGKGQGMDDVPDYLFALVGGTRMAIRDLIGQEDWDDTTRDLVTEFATLGLEMVKQIFWTRRLKSFKQLLELDLIDLHVLASGEFPGNATQEALTGYVKTDIKSGIYPGDKLTVDTKRPQLCYSRPFGFFIAKGLLNGAARVEKPGLTKQLNKDGLALELDLVGGKAWVVGDVG